MLCFDSSYLVRLYFKDLGYQIVRELATTASVACAQHGRAEVIVALHRKLREGSMTPELYTIALEEFADEIQADAYRWFPLSPAVFERVHRVFLRLPPALSLRAADALHLACAA